MSLRNSKDNLTANIYQQLPALIIAVLVPLNLGVEDYAKITVINVLMAFLPIVDFGMANVYNRKMPSIYAQGNDEAVTAWSVTLSKFRLYSSLVFAAIMSIYYLKRYGSLSDATALFFLIVTIVLTSYITINATVRSDFGWIKNLTLIQSLGKLLTVPGVILAGVNGWFIGQIVGVATILLNQRARTELLVTIGSPRDIDWSLIRSNLSQGIMLSLIATIWLQLMSSGRIYASFSYSENVIAQYGLVGALYQIVASMSIAIFVPQTIKIYRMIEQDLEGALNYAFTLVIYSCPVFIILGLALIKLSPITMELIFPKYEIDQKLYAPLLFCLFNMAIMVTQGSILVGVGRTKSYLGLLIAAGFAYFFFANVLFYERQNLAAAEAQLLTLSSYCVALVLLVYHEVKGVLKNKMMYLGLCIPSILAPIIYLLAFY